MKFLPTDADLASHESGIAIVFDMMLVFMLLAILTGIASTRFPVLVSYSADLWKLFMAAWGSLLYALNQGTKTPGPPTPPHPAVAGA
jgi:hypothetical protein